MFLCYFFEKCFVVFRGHGEVLFSGGTEKCCSPGVTEKCCSLGLRRSVVLRSYGEVLFSENTEKCCSPGGRKSVVLRGDGED